MASEYQERDAVRIILLESSDGGTTWTPVEDPTAGGGGGGGAPTDANYLVGTANGDLSAEIVAGTTPGGDLANTWASPTVAKIRGNAVDSGTPALGEAYVWDGDSFVPTGVARTVHNTTTVVCPDDTSEHSMLSSTYAIPADSLAAGDKLEFTAVHTAVNTVGSSQGITWKTFLDSTNVGQNSTGATGLTNNYVGGGMYHVVLIVGSIGASGSIVVISETFYNGSFVSTELFDLRATGVFTLDTTQDITFDITAQKTSANAALDASLLAGVLQWTRA